MIDTHNKLNVLHKPSTSMTSHAEKTVKTSLVTALLGKECTMTKKISINQSKFVGTERYYTKIMAALKETKQLIGNSLQNGYSQS